MNEDFWVLTTVVLGILAGGFAQAWLFARAEIDRIKRSDDAGDSGAIRRLETAIEAVALEVERVGEHQRHAARLLEERREPMAPAGGGPGSSIRR